jgi:hypothetical protein
MCRKPGERSESSLGHHWDYTHERLTFRLNRSGIMVKEAQTALLAKARATPCAAP